MRTAWDGYFALFPDYRIDAAETTRHGDTVGLFGSASGSLRGTGDPSLSFHVPAAWRAVLQGELVSEWHVYCDTGEMRRILSSEAQAGGSARGGRKKGFGATDPRIAPYVEALLHPEDEVLAEIRERSAREGLPTIAVGTCDGRHLEVLARMAGARRIVEIGTLGGYSGTCLARALPEGGVLHTFEIEPRHARVAEESFRRADILDRVRIHVGPALERLHDIEPLGPFDLVFIDADKAAYPDYLAWTAEHLRVGGVVVADNVFRRAAFTVEGDPPDAGAGTRRFNEELVRSGRFRATFLPLEDGFAVGVKVR
jgi:caffeoyl-CoA O-methyltransferase